MLSGRWPGDRWALWFHGNPLLGPDRSSVWGLARLVRHRRRQGGVLRIAVVIRVSGGPDLGEQPLVSPIELRHPALVFRHRRLRPSGLLQVRRQNDALPK